MKSCPCLVSVAVAVSAICAAAANYGSLSAKVARRLVREALIAMKQDDPGVSLVPYTHSYAPEFLACEAMWPNSNGSGLIGYFAVNPWTGDVWEINACRKISSPAIKKTQQSIWKKSKLPPEADATLRDKTQRCTPEPISPQDR